MNQKSGRYASLPGLIIALTLPIAAGIFTAGILTACASPAPAPVSAGHNIAPPQEQEELYLFEVRSPQDLVYNGKKQGISYYFTGDGKPDIVYYTSQKDRAEDREGSRTDPVDAGTYYVRLVRPARGKTIPAEEFFAILNIKKLPVKIEAAKTQQAVYDGNPKRVEALATPQLPLSFSYYPNTELMETAKRSASEAEPGQNTMVQSFRGYKRINTAPIEQGTYYVWIYYPGDDNHEAASLDVEFTIVPPKR